MTHIIYAPDPTFTGHCYGMEFCDGVGQCDNDFLAGFLCAKGFAVIPEESAESGDSITATNAAGPLPDNLNELRIDELVGIARSRGVPLAGIPQGNRKKLIEAIEMTVNGGG